MKHNVPFILFFIIVMLVALRPSHSSEPEKVTFCHIDSISTEHKESYSSEMITKYWTDCDMSFCSNKEYKLGDSVETKTIVMN